MCNNNSKPGVIVQQHSSSGIFFIYPVLTLMAISFFNNQCSNHWHAFPPASFMTTTNRNVVLSTSRPIHKDYILQKCSEWRYWMTIWSRSTQPLIRILIDLITVWMSLEHGPYEFLICYWFSKKRLSIEIYFTDGLRWCITMKHAQPQPGAPLIQEFSYQIISLLFQCCNKPQSWCTSEPTGRQKAYLTYFRLLHTSDACLYI